jgi:hypothetical protein
VAVDKAGHQDAAGRIDNLCALRRIELRPDRLDLPLSDQDVAVLNDAQLAQCGATARACAARQGENSGISNQQPHFGSGLGLWTILPRCTGKRKEFVRFF